MVTEAVAKFGGCLDRRSTARVVSPRCFGDRRCHRPVAISSESLDDRGISLDIWWLFLAIMGFSSVGPWLEKIYGIMGYTLDVTIRLAVTFVGQKAPRKIGKNIKL